MGQQRTWGPWRRRAGNLLLGKALHLGGRAWPPPHLLLGCGHLSPAHLCWAGSVQSWPRPPCFPASCNQVALVCPQRQSLPWPAEPGVLALAADQMSGPGWWLPSEPQLFGVGRLSVWLLGVLWGELSRGGVRKAWDRTPGQTGTCTRLAGTLGKSVGHSGSCLPRPCLPDLPQEWAGPAGGPVRQAWVPEVKKGLSAEAAWLEAGEKPSPTVSAGGAAASHLCELPHGVAVIVNKGDFVPARGLCCACGG